MPQASAPSFTLGSDMKRDDRRRLPRPAGTPSQRGKGLFCILMVLVFLPMLQANVLHIPVKPLNGVVIETEKPIFSIASLRSGDYTKQKEAYVGEHFGFREPVIRLYNQYLWSCYRKTNAHDVVVGQQGWLYKPESVNDYFGKEMLRWQPSVEIAKQRFDREVKYMNRVRTLLKENDVELMAFIAPEKSYLYPDYLPDWERDTTTFNACDYFMDRFDEIGFPCIEMTNWMQLMKDTVAYPLIPQTGAHWVFPAVYAADTLFRYMGKLKGTRLPELKIGELHESKNHGTDNDLEQLLNLSLPIRKRNGYSPTAEVTVGSAPAKVKPKVLFIGNSFMWGIVNHVPLHEMFGELEFWYYFSTVYKGNPLEPCGQVVDYNLLEKLLDFDYIVWFTTANQLNKGTSSFAGAALLALSVDDSLRIAYTRRIADTLTFEGSSDERYREARSILVAHPELIPELAVDSLAARNSELAYARYTKEIRKDSVWMAALEAQAFLRTATMQQMLHAEVDRIKTGRSLYKDQTAEIQFALQCREEIEELAGRIPSNEKLMPGIMEKAEKFNKPLEKAIKDDAAWLVRRKYGLEACRFSENPDAEIPLPAELQLK